MANECNDHVQIPKAGETKTAFGSPLSDHGYASGVFKACRASNDSAMLQSHGFPKDPLKSSTEDRLRDREISRLGDQQKQYHKETADTEAHQLGTTHGHAPKTPLHDKVEEGVKHAREDAKRKAWNSLNPDQQRELTKERADYDKKMDETYHHGHGKSPFAKDPEPGPAMKDYEKRVEQREQDDLKKNPK
jgi:hypothetical protein